MFLRNLKYITLSKLGLGLGLNKTVLSSKKMTSFLRPIFEMVFHLEIVEIVSFAEEEIGRLLFANN